MATTLRFDPALADQLRAESERTGRSQASLITEAVRRMLSGTLPDDGLPELPQATPFQDFPEHLLIDGGPPTAELLDELRADRL
ncbi:MAG: ribbon-helix-helix domain-containing protein [Micrococcales bacterium]|nr:ribbon-helix-helix domain-containing protein [Micrococcales bacterium]